MRLACDAAAKSVARNVVGRMMRLLQAVVRFLELAEWENIDGGLENSRHFYTRLEGSGVGCQKKVVVAH